MNKISGAQVSQLMKEAAANLRSLSEENYELREKVAHFEKKARAEQIANKMVEKGFEPELSLDEKVAGLMKREDLDVVEEAVGLAAPQMKLASVASDDRVQVETGGEESPAEDSFVAQLVGMD